MTHKRKMTHRGRRLYRNTHGAIYRVGTKKPKPANRHSKRGRVLSTASSA
jgi:hypothetical protein